MDKQKLAEETAFQIMESEIVAHDEICMPNWSTCGCNQKLTNTILEALDKFEKSLKEDGWKDENGTEWFSKEYLEQVRNQTIDECSSEAEKYIFCNELKVKVVKAILALKTSEVGKEMDNKDKKARGLE